MRSKVVWAAVAIAVAGPGSQAFAQRGATASVPDERVKALVARLDLERYKATIKGLTQFGDRRQGTDRNRAAVDWIEAQLKSYGCPTERVKYEYKTPLPNPNPPAVPATCVPCSAQSIGSGSGCGVLPAL